MNPNEFQKIAEVIHAELKEEPNKHCFVMHEKDKRSLMKQINVCFKPNDVFFILRQNEQKHTIKFFKDEGTDEWIDKKKHAKPKRESCKTDYTTDCSCDYIIFRFNQKKGDISIYLCEIKSSYCQESVKTARRQFKASTCFVKYFIECCNSYYHKNISVSMHNFHYIYLYPSSAPKRFKTSRGNLHDEIKMIFKPTEVSENGCVNISAKEILGC
ncbi:hypothetical protein NHP21005_17300 [Helicobacter sp. NHP21005]|uniref:hypothetical protein n=1 Tax=Helicobacter felistomachi TaxID=3040201 RepID=UPI002573CDD8|nr:hypothetical protein [Helicobacter sp. NHP21005]BEG58042.1 hypothetical protein NHP21005_17300 [Helicobacter sp. NHP21005]